MLGLLGDFLGRHGRHGKGAWTGHPHAERHRRRRRWHQWKKDQKGKPLPPDQQPDAVPAGDPAYAQEQADYQEALRKWEMQNQQYQQQQGQGQSQLQQQQQAWQQEQEQKWQAWRASQTQTPAPQTASAAQPVAPPPLITPAATAVLTAAVASPTAPPVITPTATKPSRADFDRAKTEWLASIKALNLAASGTGFSRTEQRNAAVKAAKARMATARSNFEKIKTETGFSGFNGMRRPGNLSGIVAMWQRY